MNDDNNNIEMPSWYDGEECKENEYVEYENEEKDINKNDNFINTLINKNQQYNEYRQYNNSDQYYQYMNEQQKYDINQGKQKLIDLNADIENGTTKLYQIQTKYDDCERELFVLNQTKINPKDLPKITINNVNYERNTSNNFGDISYGKKGYLNLYYIKNNFDKSVFVLNAANKISEIVSECDNSNLYLNTMSIRLRSGSTSYKDFNNGHQYDNQDDSLITITRDVFDSKGLAVILELGIVISFNKKALEKLITNNPLPGSMVSNKEAMNNINKQQLNLKKIPFNIRVYDPSNELPEYVYIVSSNLPISILVDKSKNNRSGIFVNWLSYKTKDMLEYEFSIDTIFKLNKIEIDDFVIPIFHTHEDVEALLSQNINISLISKLELIREIKELKQSLQEMVNNEKNTLLERDLIIKKYDLEDRKIDHEDNKMICETNRINANNDHSKYMMDQKEYLGKLKIFQTTITHEINSKELSKKFQYDLEIVKTKASNERYKSVSIISKVIDDFTRPIFRMFGV